MTQRKNLILFFLFVVCPAAGAATFVHADDEAVVVERKVVCFGDSITKRGYPLILGELLNVQSSNAGVGGNTSRQALKRIDKDVLSKQPDVVVIFFGTNDLRVDAPKKYVKLDEYRLNLEKMIKACRSQNAQVVLCTLPPIEPKAYLTRHEKRLFDELGGLETMVQSYRKAAIDVAKQAQVPLVDLNQLLKEQPHWLSSDGVHPSKAGNAIIAEHISSAVEPLLNQKIEPETSSD